MKFTFSTFFLAAALTGALSSCSMIEKASMHGFHSGFYKTETPDQKLERVYADVSEEKIELYHQENNKPLGSPFFSTSLVPSDSFTVAPLTFRKNSLDLDLTAIPLKYRFPTHGIPAQMAADFNAALYAGWRHDTYTIRTKYDPLGRPYPKISGRGFDFGIFAGPGATPVNPSTTQDNISHDYSGLILQTGVAGFVESSFASFGIAVGLDHLMNPDRSIWIYTNKPWVGFIVGVALN